MRPAKAGSCAEPVDERQQHAVELAAERMLRIVAHFLEEIRRGGDDPVHQEFVGAIEFQQRRHLGADLVADHGHGVGLGQRLMHHAQEIVEQSLMLALRHEAAQRAGGERRQIDRLQLRGDAAGDEIHQTRGFRGADRLRQQPQREAGEIGAALAVAQPVGDEGAEVDLAQLRFDGARFKKMHLDELAELVGDAVLVALDDGGVRDRQAQGPLEQRHHGVPVGEPSDGGGFRERCDETERRMQRQQQFGNDEQRQRPRQHQRRQRLDPPQFGGPRGIARRVEGEGGGDGHGGFRDNENLVHRNCKRSRHPEVRAPARLVILRGSREAGSRHRRATSPTSQKRRPA